MPLTAGVTIDRPPRSYNDLAAPDPGVAASVLGSGSVTRAELTRPRSSLGSRPTRQPHNGVPEQPYGDDLRYGPPVELGYARVSTAKQDLDRQVDGLQQAGVAPERIFLDKKSGATTDRPGLKAALAYACRGDVLVVHNPGPVGPHRPRHPQPHPRPR